MTESTLDNVCCAFFEDNAEELAEFMGSLFGDRRKEFKVEVTHGSHSLKDVTRLYINLQCVVKGTTIAMRVECQGLDSKYAYMTYGACRSVLCWHTLDIELWKKYLKDLVKPTINMLIGEDLYIGHDVADTFAKTSAALEKMKVALQDIEKAMENDDLKMVPVIIATGLKAYNEAKA
jgi:hypothetical protein